MARGGGAARSLHVGEATSATRSPLSASLTACSGLLHVLLDVPDSSALLQQPWVGASWEGYVVEQILGELSARGVRVTPYFFRTSDGQEIDLVLDTGTERWAIDVKLTGSPSPADMEKLDRAADLIGATRRYLESLTPRSAGTATRASCNLSGVMDRLTS